MIAPLTGAAAWLTGLSPRGWLAAGLAVLFALWTWRVHELGYDAAARACRTAALEARIRKLEVELRLARDADAAEDRLLAELSAETAQQKTVIDAYGEALRRRPDRCLLGPDAERLQ